MVPPIEEIKKNYQKLPDSKLIELGTHSAEGLRPEALEALKDELKARGLDKGFDKALEMQNKELAPGELSLMVNLIRHLPCPYCKQQGPFLNAIRVHNVRSFIFLTNASKKIVVGCEDCLTKANTKAIYATGLLGWWGIPFGLIRTPIALVKDFRNFGKIKSTEPSDLLKIMVTEHRGSIAHAAGNEALLTKLIADITA